MTSIFNAVSSFKDSTMNVLGGMGWIGILWFVPHAFAADPHLLNSLYNWFSMGHPTMAQAAVAVGDGYSNIGTAVGNVLRGDIGSFALAT